MLNRLHAMYAKLRHLSVASPRLPTVALVGAPNVGKSSIIRSISTSKAMVGPLTGLFDRQSLLFVLERLARILGIACAAADYAVPFHHEKHSSRPRHY